MSTTMKLETLKQAVAGKAAALRSVTEYQPAGGHGDKIFPPTYEGGQYAIEKRRLPGEAEPVICVLLDSVQSQANRMELSLLEARRRKAIPLPVITVDFSGNALLKVLKVTSLEAPHRIADAILRDSLVAGIPFRKSAIGSRLDDVDIHNATALFELCPTTLIFGMWDSTGPKGGGGAKFARALVSEIIGIHAEVGKKTSSRLDPAQIMLSAGPLYRTKDNGWTLDEKQALRDRKGPVKLGKDGKPSEANHGNVMPSITEGGVTVSRALQTTVLSLPALRRLRFPISGTSDPKVDEAGQTALAALALCAATLSRDEGCDLRSRCLLHAVSPFSWELLDNPSVPPISFELPGQEAIALLASAVAEAKKVGLPWLEDELVLTPSPELVALVKKSQELAAQTALKQEGGE